MVVKTITVTEEAYNAIKRLKTDNESFSELFNRLGNKQLRVKDLIGVLKHTPQEAAEFRRRVIEERNILSGDMERRIDDVRTRFKRAH